MEVYFGIVILHPTKKQQEEDGAVPTLVAGPEVVVAKDEQQAAMKVFKFVKEEDAKHIDRLEVRLCPFRPVKK